MTVSSPGARVSRECSKSRVRRRGERPLQLAGPVARDPGERQQPGVDVVVNLESGAGVGEQDRGFAAETSRHLLCEELGVPFRRPRFLSGRAVGAGRYEKRGQRGMARPARRFPEVGQRIKTEKEGHCGAGAEAPWSTSPIKPSTEVQQDA